MIKGSVAPHVLVNCGKGDAGARFSGGILLRLMKVATNKILSRLSSIHCDSRNYSRSPESVEALYALRLRIPALWLNPDDSLDAEELLF